MLRLYILLIIVVTSCARDNRINLSDLTFPDPARFNSMRNQVDTTFFCYPQEDGSELVFYQTFDRHGRVVCDSTQPYTLVRFYYDSLGFLAKKVITTNGRYTWIDSLAYKFDRDSLVLEQRWISSKKTHRYSFDDAGRLLRSLELDQTNILQKEVRYIYEADVLKTCIVKLDKMDKAQIESNFYYSANGTLDSSTSQTNYGYRQAWAYDSLGLLVNEWRNESKQNVRFIHKMKM